MQWPRFCCDDASRRLAPPGCVVCSPFCLTACFSAQGHLPRPDGERLLRIAADVESRLGGRAGFQVIGGMNILTRFNH
jgi:hypothetical protein